MIILGIESSCDETAIALVQNGTRIMAQRIASQIPAHRKFGGVVPEIASRKHIESIIGLIHETFQEARLGLEEVEAIAVTIGPGLVGSLLIGVSAGKALAYAQHKPLIPINHIEGHIAAIFLTYPDMKPPFIALVVSGGHTSLFTAYNFTEYGFLGGTRDDAAGEAFDKVAKILHLGYPGGPVIDRLARKGNPGAIPFPRVYLEKTGFDFSFSGLKTSVFNYIRSQGFSLMDYQQCSLDEIPSEIRDIAASFQEAVVDTLIFKAIEACRRQKVNHLVLAGGVACNSRLRERLKEEADQAGLEVSFPSPLLCTDNAAMIAAAGYFHSLKGDVLRGADIFSLNAVSNLPLGIQVTF